MKKMPEMSVSSYFWFIIILFGWIALLPPPLQGQFDLFIKTFLFIFLFIVMPTGKQAKALFSLQDWPVWLFLICMCSGIISARDRNVALMTFIYLFTNMFFLFYIGKAIFCSDGYQKFIFMIITVLSGLVALLGIVEVFLGHIYKISGLLFPKATQLHQTPLATYLLLTLPFAFYFLRQKNRRVKIFAASVIILEILCLLLTFSHRAIIGLIAMLIFYLCAQREYKKIFVIFLTVIVLMSMANFLPFPAHLLNLKSFGGAMAEIFSEFRMTRVGMSLAMFKNNPIFGVGFENFRVLFDRYYPVKNQILHIPFDKKIVDNMYFTLLAEAGIVGFAGFFILISFIFKRGLSRLKELKVGNEKTTMLILMSALIALLIDMNGYELLYWNNPYMFFCLICGFIFASIGKNKN